MSSEASDADPEDFWGVYEEEESVDPGSPLKGSPEMKRMVTSKFSSPSKFFFKKVTSIPEDFFKQRMQMSIENLRKENEIQINAVKSAVRTKTRRDLKSAVDEIRAQFEREVFLIKQDHDKMKNEIAQKNQEIMLIAEYMIDQETMITQYRLGFLLKQKPVEDSAELVDEEKQLKKDLNVLRVQIDAMKDAIRDYTNETVQSAAKVKELDQEIALIQAKHKQELKELEAYLEERVNKAIQERDSIREQYENYKKTGWDDLENKEKCCETQREVILNLQNELKKAKGILHNPRLKLRVHERLKDYLDEYEMENNESSALLPIKSAGHRRSKTIEKRNIHTSKANYDKSTRFGSLQEPSVELPKFKVKNLPINDMKIS